MEVRSIPSWFDRHEGVVVVEDDVQNIVRGMREISDRLSVFYNPQSGAFDIVERCLDGTDRLCFSVSQLDARVLDRLRAADHWHGQDVPEHVLGDDEDFVAQLDAYQAEREEALREKLSEDLGDVTERLARALDNTSDRPSVGGTISVPKDIHG